MAEDAAQKVEDAELREDAAGLWALDMRNDWVYFEVGDSEAKAFEQKAHCQAGIAYWVGKLMNLGTCYYVHIPKTLLNYIERVLPNFLHQLEQSKVPVEQTFHSSRMHQQEAREKYFQLFL